MNSVRLNNLGLKYQKFTPADEKIQGFDNLRLWQRLNSFKKDSLEIMF